VSPAATVSANRSLSVLRNKALHCQACPLWRCGTQTVFGEGASRAHLMLVGEQPGDQEDRQGRPFVGPAGRLLDGALAEAGIERSTVYLTNAVKHFKWVARGKRRLHQKPSTTEVTACWPWLLAEIDVVKPQLILCMGATAAQAFFGSSFRVTQHRGQVVASPYAGHVDPRIQARIMTTVHPSSVLRAPDQATRERETALFVADLRAAAALLESGEAAASSHASP
jgi:uracil-DNA glycosylase family protein